MADQTKFTYPGQEQMGQAWDYLQESIDAVGTQLTDFTNYISSNWTNSGNIIDPVKYSREAAPALDKLAQATLEDVIKNNRASGRSDPIIIKEAKLLTLRSQLGTKAQGYFDTLMRDDTLQRLLNKHAGEPGVAELKEEARQHPETVAFALAQNAGLGTGRLDWAGDRWLAAKKLWDGTTTEMSGGMKDFFDKAKDWTLFGFDIGWIFSGIRIAIEACTNIPNMIKTGIKVLKGLCGYDKDFEAALAEVQQAGMNQRLADSLKGVGSEAFGRDLADIFRDPAKANALPPLPTTLPEPTRAPDPNSPTETEGQGMPVAKSDGTGTVVAGAAGTTVGAARADKLKNVPAPGAAPLASAATGPEDFNPESIKAAHMWRDIVIATATAAPFSAFIPGGKLNPRPDIMSLTVDPSDRDIARHISTQTAYDAYRQAELVGYDINQLPENSFARKRLETYTDLLVKKYRDGNTPNSAQQKALVNAIDTMRSEFQDFSRKIENGQGNVPAVFQMATDAEEGPYLLANGITQTNSEDIKTLTIDEAAKDASIAGILAYRKYKGQPTLLADEIVTALLNPQNTLMNEKAKRSIGQGDTRYTPSGELAPTEAERMEYAKWLLSHQNEIGDAYDRSIAGKEGHILNARNYLTNGEVAGLKQAMYAAAQQPDGLDLSKLSAPLKALYENTDLLSSNNPDDLSKTVVLSAADFDFLSAAENKVSFAGIKTPLYVLRARTEATQIDAQILQTAVGYGVFQGSTDEIRSALTTLEKNIGKAPAIDGYAPGVRIPSLPTLGTAFQAPLQASLSPEQQAAQVLTQMAMLDEEKQRGLQAQRSAVREQIELGRRVAVNPTSTALGATVGITVSDVDADSSVTPNAPAGSTKTPGVQRADFV